jgi:hypothetical protein
MASVARHGAFGDENRLKAPHLSLDTSEEKAIMIKLTRTDSSRNMHRFYAFQLTATPHRPTSVMFKSSSAMPAPR